MSTRSIGYYWIYYGDLIVLGLLCILTGLSIYLLPGSLVKLLTGTVFFFFAPGYSLLAALYSDRRSLGMAQRISASLGLSVVSDSLLLMLANYLFRISVDHSYWILFGWTGVMIAITSIRRHRTPEDDRFFIHLDMRVLEIGKAVRSNKILALVKIALLMLLVTSAGRLLLISARTSPQYAEFYLLGEGGYAAGYPVSVQQDETFTVTVEVTNHGLIGSDFHIEVWVFDPLIQEGESRLLDDLVFNLTAGQVLEVPVVLQMPWSGYDQRLDFFLYVNGQNEPERKLYLWLDVLPPESR